MMLSESTWLALLASFAWGVLSIVLSPCHLSSIPLVIGFINKKEIPSVGRADLISTLFTYGILLALVLIGVGTAMAGRLLGDAGMPLQLIIAFTIILFGLHLMEIIRLPLPDQDGQKYAGMKRGLLTVFILGIVMGTALGPCSFAFLAPLIGIALASSQDVLFSLSLFTAYGLGHGAVIVLAGTFSGALGKYLDWNEQSRAVLIVKKISGVLVVCAGLYIGYTALQGYL